MPVIHKSDIERVLRKLGVNPAERIDPHDQDAESTSCRVEELCAYLELYEQPETFESEKHVLCRYMLECLNETIQSGVRRRMEGRILRELFANRALHEEELAYWMDTSDPEEDNWWPITRVLLEYEKEAQEGG